MSQEAIITGQSYVINTTFWIATAIFIVSLIVIITEKVHKAVVAIVGATLMLVLKILDQHEAFHLEELGVDWNVIFLLISTMVIINLMKPTGFFEYVAIKSAKWGRGEPFRILAIFSIVTAFISALLPNVTTVILIAPVMLLIADALEVNPTPYLISCALASNIGGTATLIGDPPNLMIGSRVSLNFMDFVYHLTPIVIIIMVCYIVAIKLIWGKQLQTKESLKKRIMNMNEREAIKDPVMLRNSLFVLTVVFMGFIFHGMLGLEVATVGLFGAGLLLLLSRSKEPRHIFAEIEWSTIFFFIGLFIIVGGVVKVGLIKWMSIKMVEITGGNLFITSMVMIWFSAFASAIVDNIPYVATMIPLVSDMAKYLWPDLSGVQLLQHPALMPVWWSLALGACLGGNGTVIGAAANIVVVGMAEKTGKKISFIEFMKYGMPIMIMTVIVSTLYVWLRYYVIRF